MTSRVFVLGNGESRKNVNLDGLKSVGPVYGCNALYRDFTPDALICVDGGMMHEVYESGYALKNKCYYRSWSKLPGDAYHMLVDTNLFEGWHKSLHTENPKQGRTQFVLNGTDPNQMMRLVELAKKIASDRGEELDEVLLRQQMGNHHQWVTWVEENDEVYLIPEDYSGWSAGPIAVRMAIEDYQPEEVFLIGFDLGSSTGLVNNVYKGTSNYVTQDAKETPSVNWIKQHTQNFEAYPNIKFWKINPAPLGTDGSSQFVEEWKDYDNVEYLEQENLNLVLDYGVLL